MSASPPADRCQAEGEEGDAGGAREGSRQAAAKARWVLLRQVPFPFPARDVVILLTILIVRGSCLSLRLSLAPSGSAKGFRRHHFTFIFHSAPRGEPHFRDGGGGGEMR